MVSVKNWQFLHYFYFRQNRPRNDIFSLFLWKTQIKRKFKFLDRIHGLTQPEILHFFALLKTSAFWSKNHCFLSKTSKTDLIWHYFCKKHRWKKVRFLDKNNGLTPLESVHFFGSFQNFNFFQFVFNFSFLSTISKNDLFWHTFCKTRR